jgi:hypothetical protein
MTLMSTTTFIRSRIQNKKREKQELNRSGLIP